MNAPTHTVYTRYRCTEKTRRTRLVAQKFEKNTKGQQAHLSAPKASYAYRISPLSSHHTHTTGRSHCTSNTPQQTAKEIRISSCSFLLLLSRTHSLPFLNINMREYAHPHLSFSTQRRASFPTHTHPHEILLSLSFLLVLPSGGCAKRSNARCSRDGGSEERPRGRTGWRGGWSRWERRRRWGRRRWGQRILHRREEGGLGNSVEGLASEARHGHTLSKSKGKREPQREIFEKPRKQKINKSRDRIFSTLPPSRCPPNHVHHDPHGLLNIIMCSEYKKHSAFRKHTC